MNVEIATEAPQFPEKEYINGIFLAVYGNREEKKYFHVTNCCFNFRASCFPNHSIGGW
jgi:hypothetical protein